MSAIPVEKLEEGYTSALENADRLLKDAQILHRQARYASSIQLSALSVEEAGKASRIAEYLSQGKEITEAEWKNPHGFFRKHGKKFFKAHEEAAAFALVELEKAGASPQVTDESISNTYTAERKLRLLKELATYLDYNFVNERWMRPREMDSANAKFAKVLWLYAKSVVGVIRKQKERSSV
jgi:AbiV family abortive infection protein